VVQGFEDLGLFGPRNRPPDSASPFAARITEHPNTKSAAQLYNRLSSDKHDSDAFPLPHVDDVIARLYGATILSCIDLSDGYHNLAMHPDDRHKTAFVPPTGLFEWTVLLLGVTNGPAQFSRFMANVTDGLPHVVFYLDDLFVASTSVDEHIDDLMALGGRLAADGLLVNRAKLQLGMEGGLILGHTLIRSRLYISPDKQARLASELQTLSIERMPSDCWNSATTSARGYPTSPTLRSPTRQRPQGAVPARGHRQGGSETHAP